MFTGPGRRLRAAMFFPQKWGGGLDHLNQLPGSSVVEVRASLEVRLRKAQITGTFLSGSPSERRIRHTMEEPDASPSGQTSPLDSAILALAELSERLDDLPSLAEAASAVAEFAVAHLGADLAGVSLRGPHGRPTRLGGSGDLLAELDAAEVGLTAGPSTVRLDDGAAITIADTRADRLWPDWSAAAAALDVHSVRLLGMPPLDGRSVTLQLFSFRAGAFAPDELAELVPLAKLAGLALRHTDQLANLNEAMATRDLIGQAQGIIMERYDLTSEQAMQFLRRISQHSHEKVRHLAHQLVSPRTEASPPGEGEITDDDPSADDR